MSAYSVRRIAALVRDITSRRYQAQPIPSDASEDERDLLEALNALSDDQEELMRAGQSRDRLIIDSTPVAICITDRRGNFEYVNPRYQTLTGYTAEELVGRSFQVVVPEDERQELQHLHDEFMGQRYELEGRWRIRNKSGAVIPILANAAYVIDVDGFAKKITFVVDVTDLEREVEERRRAEQMRDEVARVLRHDLRNPLDGIRTAADYLLQEDLPPRAEEFVRLMYEAAVRARNRIDNSLAYTRMQQGTHEVERDRVNAVQLVRDVIHNVRDLLDAYRVTAVASYKGEPLETQYDIELWGENGFLMDAVGNLVRNAVEASSAGDTVTVEVDDSPTPDIDHGEHTGAVSPPAVSIAVHNPAPIPSEIRATLFDPYVTHGKSGGTGLGTYTARMVAEAHGGTVTMQTGEDTGTTMTIIVPRGRPEGLS